MRMQTITRYLFHRFLLEAILAPAAVGVTDVQPDEKTLRTLTLVHQVCSDGRACSEMLHCNKMSSFGGAYVVSTNMQASADDLHLTTVLEMVQTAHSVHALSRTRAPNLDHAFCRFFVCDPVCLPI